MSDARKGAVLAPALTISAVFGWRSCCSRGSSSSTRGQSRVFRARARAVGMRRDRRRAGARRRRRVTRAPPTTHPAFGRRGHPPRGDRARNGRALRQMPPPFRQRHTVAVRLAGDRGSAWDRRLGRCAARAPLWLGCAGGSGGHGASQRGLSAGHVSHTPNPPTMTPSAPTGLPPTKMIAFANSTSTESAHMTRAGHGGRGIFGRRMRRGGFPRPAPREPRPRGLLSSAGASEAAERRQCRNQPSAAIEASR
jgi:hypothetical protein